MNLEKFQTRKLSIYIARALECCSTDAEGLKIIYDRRNLVFRILSLIFNEKSDEKEVIYSTATVLLDLTAHESCIE